MSPIEAARLSEEWTDASVERAKEIYPPERPIACARGCAHCCRLRVLATRAEVLRVAEAVRALGPERSAEIIARVRVVAESNAARETCPLLAGEECSVYASRPIACRAMSSLDAGACKEGGLIPLYLPQLRIGEAARQRLSTELGGELGEIVDLARGLHAVFRTPE